jgi:hypothetical protein
LRHDDGVLVMGLEEALRRAGQKARAITLWKTEKGWQANVSPDKVAWSVAIHEDPVRALLDAIEQTRVAPAPEPAPVPPKPRSVFD